MGSDVRRVKRECVPGGEPQVEWRPKMMYRIAFPPPSLVLGTMLFVACQDNPVAPPATRPALAASLLDERGESRPKRTFDFTTIDVPGALSTSASGINARGDIVGSYMDGKHHSHGYLLH